MIRIYKLFVLLVLFLSPSAYSCTNFFLKASDGTVVNARTMEFGTNLKSRILIVARDQQFQSSAPKNNKGLSWQNKYGYLAIDVLGNKEVIVDGQNEKGLSLGGLWMPQSTTYKTPTEEEYKQSLAITQFGAWALGNFATVDEVKEAVNNIIVWGDYLEELKTVPPMHIAITDAKGQAIVIEFIDGKTTVHDNKSGVLTNEPNFQWQRTNLKNYINLTPYNPAPVTVDGITYSATGQGSGMKGLPGDWTPPSRFVKSSLMLASVDKPKSAQETVQLAQHIMNNFDIPKGVIRDRTRTEQDHTQWTVFKDLTNGRLYYKSYNDSQLRMIDLKQLKFDGSIAYKAIPIQQDKPTIVQMNSALEEK